MSETFTKLFQSILRSTIWCEDHPTRLVWVSMLAMCDKRGYVGASIPGLAAAARVTIPEAEAAIAKFLGPDRYSRTKDNEGRRIEEVDRGWRLLNYGRFRDARDAEARRAYDRDRKRKSRAGQTRTSPESPPGSAQVDADAEVQADPEGGDAS